MEKNNQAQDRAGAIALVKGGGSIAIAGAAGFVLVVVLLQHVQVDYDPVHQLMSELALGHRGEWMIAAFLGLAMAIGGIGIGMLGLQAGALARILPQLAGMAFASAGAFPLGGRFDIHIPMVAAAFVLSGLLMFLGPLRMPGKTNPLAIKRDRRVKLVSWGLALAMAASVLLGHALLPIGIAQRMAAAFLLLWVVLGGVWLWRVARHAEQSA